MPGWFLTVNPWDLVDEGVEGVLDRLQGEVGVSGVTLVASAAPSTLLRVRAVAPRVIRTRGGLLFPPREEYYAATRLRAAPSDALRRKPGITELAERCRARGLTVRLELQAATLGRVLSRYPDAGCRNALEDRSTMSLCLNQPDVQALLGGLMADGVGQVPCDGVVFRAWRIRWEEARRAESMGGAAWSETARRLLGWCFCESCLRQSAEAGVDAASVKRMVTTTLDAIWSEPGGKPGILEHLIEEHEPLRRFLGWRQESLRAAWGGLVESAPCPVAVVVGDGEEPEEMPVEFIEQTGGRAVRWVEPGIAAADPPVSGGEVMLCDDYASRIPSAEVVSLAQQAARGGCEAIHFGNVACLSDGALTGIKQAIRFARRAGA